MYLKSIQVPIPFDKGKITVRKGKSVQLELRRTYSRETKDSRVVRRTIGQVVPLYEDRMYPNENYFALVPNEVPEEIRDPFLLRCARQRENAALKKDPAALARRVAEGVAYLKEKGKKTAAAAASGYAAGTPGGPGSPAVPGAPADPEEPEKPEWYITDAHDLDYIRNVFNALYSLMISYGARYPDSEVDGYKIGMLNRMLTELKDTLPDHQILQGLEQIGDSPDCRTYSDVLMLLTWYSKALG